MINKLPLLINTDPPSVLWALAIKKPEIDKVLFSSILNSCLFWTFMKALPKLMALSVKFLSIVILYSV